ncbi:hypothetical protein BB559_003170 [Furculomyces boomerangus]|uniref:C2H2-type domain-containing protein n=1 Tax=Furculomyces boomerangus TaxID=61424 RepID=A0A2T9YN57_9FUNG|nr:hypothetical protein BB559_003170 [Furculomyces boomerangus]
MYTYQSIPVKRSPPEHTHIHVDIEYKEIHQKRQKTLNNDHVTRLQNIELASTQEAEIGSPLEDINTLEKSSAKPTQTGSPIKSRINSEDASLNNFTQNSLLLKFNTSKNNDSEYDTNYESGIDTDTLDCLDGDSDSDNYVPEETEQEEFSDIEKNQIDSIEKQQLYCRIEEGAEKTPSGVSNIDENKPIQTKTSEGLNSSNRNKSSSSLSGRQYKCSFCEKIYKKPSKLEEHERSHTGERPFKCIFPDCGKAYMKQSHLAVHSRTHDEGLKKKYKCSYENCDAGFSTNQHLKRHLASHSEEKPYRCTFEGCKLSFKKHKSLQMHTSRHLNEKFYKCTFENCTKSFNTPSKLREHIRSIHNTTPKYMCGYTECTEKFVKLIELKKHISECHKTKIFKCELCDKEYSRKDVLTEHMQTHSQDRTIIQCPFPDCIKTYYKVNLLKTLSENS